MNITDNNYKRRDLADLFYGVGVEVGVADGDFARFILDHNPKVKKLYGVDVYKGHEGYQDYTRKSTFEAMLEHAQAAVAPYAERHEFIFKFSMDAVKNFDDNSLDFVYIDANHSYDTVLEDITEWAKKVKPTGLVCGDDYDLPENDRRLARYDVIRAVNDYCEANGKYLNVFNGSHPRQWMFAK